MKDHKHMKLIEPLDPEKLSLRRITPQMGKEIRKMEEELKIGARSLAKMPEAVAIFGSARTSSSSPYYRLARKTARLLGRAGYQVVTGGGPGIMEAANRGAQEGGALSVGVTIKLPLESPNSHLDAELPFKWFFTRKIAYVRLSKAFVVFPGGFGTLDELFEALTLMQTGKIQKFPVVLMGTEYWQDMYKWLKKSVLAEGNISPDDLDFLVTDSPEAALKFIRAAQADSELEAA